MEGLPKKLKKKLEDREKSNALRKLLRRSDLIDFASNDYIGFSTSTSIFDHTHKILAEKRMHQNGATGSRLLSGNHELYVEAEELLTSFHNAESALIFNSGYDANVGFFSSVPQRGDIIVYDEFIHASIRDGITMSNAKSYKFKHNDLVDLSRIIERSRNADNVAKEIYVVTESVFSMDGDVPDLIAFAKFCKKNNCHFIVDEAHAVGVFGNKGVGLIQELRLENQVFARINTFGKALGCHGAVVLGSMDLRSYLVNFARSFIYTTGLPPHSLATIQGAYNELETSTDIEKLQKNIQFFNQKIKELQLTSIFIKSNSAIHCCIISGNEKVKRTAQYLGEKGFDVKPILSPTVTKGKERLRFCLHSYNTKEQIVEVLELLATFAKN
ncbi:aminotransferase class I/II-fold pyridoxal phosphate-dependent enzyme [Aquimarina sp. 2201CG14-23]|uniref:aminotransferase class I/II-fold pyridoxal phosphate-dependent enzyme n=1 Tax=Aquimarina mycalae TaxID=3040073 RepID=UPI002477FF7F|nr:pyridoxal phosphate-dependent aminotransferase family protein [Aquimarina sp. 2201CG14-23]MDH7446107.1 pyridoxal phosphate-dependent aminotransferase family protein [Aquimarina sp. 2201CG14-23]